MSFMFQVFSAFFISLGIVFTLVSVLGFVRADDHVRSTVQVGLFLAIAGLVCLGFAVVFS